jgi:ABC-type nitrate/sulfonate/bicarbonate transport system ATPase subunit
MANLKLTGNYINKYEALHDRIMHYDLFDESDWASAVTSDDVSELDMYGLAIDKLKNVTKIYEGATVLENLSLKIKSHENVAIMGESGRGKTTLLRIAAGLTKPGSGDVLFCGDVAILFQEPRLLPWKTAAENILAVLKNGTKETAQHYLEAVELADAANKYPRELSGGMAQRVALARFMAYVEETDADLLLLDEPTGALDRETAERMISLIKKLAESRTAIIVTHNEADAEAFADRILRI